MSKWSRQKTYRCFNDCQMEGCPSHVMTVTYHGVSDTFEIKIDGKDYLAVDPTVMETLKELTGPA